MNLDCIVVGIDGLVKIYKSVEQFEGMNNIYPQVKNYVLRTVHQGIFGGHVSSSGPAINRVQEDIGLRQSSLMSDAALVLSISTSGEAFLPADSLSPLSFRESLDGTRPTTHTKSQSVSKTTNFLQKN